MEHNLPTKTDNIVQPKSKGISEKTLLKPSRVKMYQKHSIRFNFHRFQAQPHGANLSYHLKQRTDFRTLRFQTKLDNNETIGEKEINDAMIKAFAQILKLSKQPQKLHINYPTSLNLYHIIIIFHRSKNLSQAGVHYLCESLKRLSSLKDIQIEFE